MTTFRELDGNYKLDTDSKNASSLELWYASVRDTPIVGLSIGDLCRACRQHLFLEHIVPFALQRIAADAVSGDMYEGELASAIARIDRKFWEEHPDFFVEAKETLNRALPDLDSEIASEIALFQKERTEGIK